MLTGLVHMLLPPCQQVQKAQFPTAWDTTTGSTGALGVGVCIVDTGATNTHPDLEANIKGGWNM